MDKICGPDNDASDASGYDDDSQDEDWLPNHHLADESAIDTGAANDASEGEEEITSESEASDNEDTAAGTPTRMGEAGLEQPREYIAKDKTVWSTSPPEIHQTASHNLLRQRSGPCRSTETLSIGETFKKIVTVEMIDLRRWCSRCIRNLL